MSLATLAVPPSEIVLIVTSAGRAIVITVPSASSGPVFWAVAPKSMDVPATAVGGAIAPASRSALKMVVEAVSRSSEGSGSVEVEVTRALFSRVPVVPPSMVTVTV